MYKFFPVEEYLTGTVTNPKGVLDLVSTNPAFTTQTLNNLSFNYCMKFNFEKDFLKIFWILNQKNIILAVREIMETKIIRVSPHFFNTDLEILQVIDEIKKL